MRRRFSDFAELDKIVSCVSEWAAAVALERCPGQPFVHESLLLYAHLADSLLPLAVPWLPARVRV